MPTGGRPMHRCRHCGAAIRFDRSAHKWVSGSKKIRTCQTIHTDLVRMHEPDSYAETSTSSVVLVGVAPR